MPTITETSDSTISAYATGSYTIGFDDTFQGTFGGGDSEDGINLPTLEAGTSYTVTMTVDDIADFHAMVLINPSNFHSTGVHMTDGVPHADYTGTHYTGFATIEDYEIVGNTVTFTFTPHLTQSFSFQVQSNSATTEGYVLSIAETPVTPIVTEDADNVTGTPGADVLDLLDGNDTMEAGDGDDDLFGNGGDDSILGGAGADSLSGGTGADSLDGGIGDDTLMGANGADTLLGGDDDDMLNGGGDNDHLLGGAGADTLNGGTGTDTLDGGAGDDVFEMVGDAVILTGDGADVIELGVNASFLTVTDFTPGTDRIDLSAIGVADMSEVTLTELGGNTVVTFSNGHTAEITLQGVLPGDLAGPDCGLAAQAATILGSNGKDNLTGTAAADVIEALGGRDQVNGQEGDDTIHGGEGNDKLWGGDDNDIVNGDAGKDRLYGDAGNDTLNGGADQDQIWGGAGADVFVFETGSGVDAVMDFEDGIDQIDLSGVAGVTGFADLTITQAGAEAHIDLGGGDMIRVAWTDAAQLDASDFIF